MTAYSGKTPLEMPNAHPWVLCYLSRPDCGVCTALRPRIERMVASFPKVFAYYVDLDRYPIVAGQWSVFSIPAVLLFVDGREMLREARHFSMDDLQMRLSRIYEQYYG